VLAQEFHDLSTSKWRTRDFTLNGMLAALEEVIAAFPVYRAYGSPQGTGIDDRHYIDWALALAKKPWRAADQSIFEFLYSVLTAKSTDLQKHPSRTLGAATHFRQLTGPVMAKAFEDTAFYRYFHLLALNEVGSDPRRFGISVAAFHHMTRSAPVLGRGQW